MSRARIPWTFRVDAAAKKKGTRSQALVNIHVEGLDRADRSPREKTLLKRDFAGVGWARRNLKDKDSDEVGFLLAAGRAFEAAGRRMSERANRINAEENDYPMVVRTGVVPVDVYVGIELSTVIDGERVDDIPVVEPIPAGAKYDVVEIAPYQYEVRHHVEPVMTDDIVGGSLIGDAVAHLHIDTDAFAGLAESIERRRGMFQRVGRMVVESIERARLRQAEIIRPIKPPSMHDFGFGVDLVDPDESHPRVSIAPTPHGWPTEGYVGNPLIQDEHGVYEVLHNVIALDDIEAGAFPELYPCWVKRLPSGDDGSRGPERTRTEIRRGDWCEIRMYHGLGGPLHVVPVMPPIYETHTFQVPITVKGETYVDCANPRCVFAQLLAMVPVMQATKDEDWKHRLLHQRNPVEHPRSKKQREDFAMMMKSWDNRGWPGPVPGEETADA